MKKVLLLIIVSLLSLSVCGQKEETTTKNKEKLQTTKNKVGFKNEVVNENIGSIKILDVKLRNASDETNGKENIVFTYEATNKTDEDFSAQAFWIAAIEVYQENDNTENKLEVGPTSTTCKYAEYFENMSDTIKKNGKAKGVVSYVLEDNNDITLKATQGNTGNELGNKIYKLSDLEKFDHSTEEDLQNQTSYNQNTTQEEPTGLSEKCKTLNTQMHRTPTNDTAYEEQRCQQSISQVKQEAISKEIKQEDISKEEYDRTKTTTNDESQKEQPQKGIGGHGSAFYPSIPKESQGVPKIDKDGNEYICNWRIKI